MIPQPARSTPVALVTLVGVSTLLQTAALVARSDRLAAGTIGRHVFSTVEMLLIGALVVVSARIVRSADARGRPAVRVVARLCLASLVLCGLGDLVNRNFLEQAYQWDHVIRHSYLITAIWCFLPGYALVIVANRVLTREVVSARAAATSVAVAAALGAVIAVTGFEPGTGTYPKVMITAYTMVMAALAASTTWLWRAHRTRAAAAIAGCLLAVAADGLIGAFWIRTDHYPTVEHANWIIYFASLALIQLLPALAGGEEAPLIAGVPVPA